MSHRGRRLDARPGSGVRFLLRRRLIEILGNPTIDGFVGQIGVRIPADYEWPLMADAVEKLDFWLSERFLEGTSSLRDALQNATCCVLCPWRWSAAEIQRDVTPPEAAPHAFRRASSALPGPSAPARAHSSPGSHQLVAHNPQVTQRKQCLELLRVLLQFPVAHLHVPKLALEHPKRMFDLRPDTGLELLDLVDQGIDRVVLGQRPALAREHRDVPVHVWCGIRAFGRPLVVRGLWPRLQFGSFGTPLRSEPRKQRRRRGLAGRTLRVYRGAKRIAHAVARGGPIEQAQLVGRALRDGLGRQAFGRWQVPGTVSRGAQFLGQAVLGGRPHAIDFDFDFDATGWCFTRCRG